MSSILYVEQVLLQQIVSGIKLQFHFTNLTFLQFIFVCD